MHVEACRLSVSEVLAVSMKCSASILSRNFSRSHAFLLTIFCYAQQRKTEKCTAEQSRGLKITFFSSFENFHLLSWANDSNSLAIMLPCKAKYKPTNFPLKRGCAEQCGRHEARLKMQVTLGYRSQGNGDCCCVFALYLTLKILTMTQSRTSETLASKYGRSGVRQKTVDNGNFSFLLYLAPK